MASPAALSGFVTAMSSRLGSGFPDGWLCARSTAASSAPSASRRSALGASSATGEVAGPETELPGQSARVWKPSRRRCACACDSAARDS